MPYFGYARQDRKSKNQDNQLHQKLVADLLTTAGVNRVVTIDFTCCTKFKDSSIFL